MSEGASREDKLIVMAFVLCYRYGSVESGGEMVGVRYSTYLESLPFGLENLREHDEWFNEHFV
jgi:hypothetical protein